MKLFSHTLFNFSKELHKGHVAGAACETLWRSARRLSSPTLSAAYSQVGKCARNGKLEKLFKEIPSTERERTDPPLLNLFKADIFGGTPSLEVGRAPLSLVTSWERVAAAGCTVSSKSSESSFSSSSSSKSEGCGKFESFLTSYKARAPPCAALACDSILHI